MVCVLLKAGSNKFYDDCLQQQYENSDCYIELVTQDGSKNRGHRRVDFCDKEYIELKTGGFTNFYNFNLALRERNFNLMFF